MDVDINIKLENKEVMSKEDTVEDEDEILVYVKFDDTADEYSLEDLNNVKILGLLTKEPILQIGNKVYGGMWMDTIGTATFFEETSPVPRKCYFSTDTPKLAKFLAKTKKSLHMRRIFITSKTSSTTNEDNIEIQKEVIACEIDQRNDE